MGVESIWYSVVVSNGISALILYLLYWTKIWEKRTIHLERREAVSQKQIRRQASRC